MLDRIENKLIDRLDNIDLMAITDLFDCKIDDVGPILTQYFEKRDYFKGNIDLMGVRDCLSLGKLKRVDGNLTVGYSNIEDLGNLKIVKGRLMILQCRIESSGKLLHCGGLVIHDKVFKTINRLTEVNGDVELSGTNITTLNDLQLIGGSMILNSNSELNNFGNIRDIDGDLVISDCAKLQDLGKLYHIGGSLDVRDAKLVSFGLLTEIGGFVIALKSNVRNLYKSGLDILDLSPLVKIFNYMPKFMHLTVPKIDKLKNFGMIVIDDDDDSFNINDLL